MPAYQFQWQIMEGLVMTTEEYEGFCSCAACQCELQERLKIEEEEEREIEDERIWDRKNVFTV